MSVDGEQSQRSRAGEAVLRQTTWSWRETGVCGMWPTSGEQIQLWVSESLLSCSFICLVNIG